jgi:hypothetical protein
LSFGVGDNRREEVTRQELVYESEWIAPKAYGMFLK